MRSTGALLVFVVLCSAASAFLAARLPFDGAKTIRREDEENHDEVTYLPGYRGPLKSKHYAGYITVDEESGRRLFYYFATSEEAPSSDPVVLWLNGGPGCSSFDGFVYEHGPFNFQLAPGSNPRIPVILEDNPYSWNTVANMLYIDSPAGVGLSYSDSHDDYVTDDSRTAKDLDTFLRKFFTKYPDFQVNDFFITGESYAGVYVPTLGLTVANNNKVGAEPYINLVGIAVGNPVSDPEFDGNALPLFAMGKSLLSVAQYNKLVEECGETGFAARQPGSKCDQLYNQYTSCLAGLNIYDVLESCYKGQQPELQGGQQQGAASSRPFLGAEELRDLRAQHGREWPLAPGIPLNSTVKNWAHLGYPPPCTDERTAYLWLNSDAVRAAIHAEPVQKIGTWTLCSPRIAYTRGGVSMMPIHKQLTKIHGVRVLVYSGDHDMAVPHTGSEAWTAHLGYNVVQPWRPWLVDDQQVAGYVVEYENGLTYATVKGAGHMVPENKPKESLWLFRAFIGGNSL